MDRVVELRARLQRLLAKTMQHRQILLRNRLDRQRMQPRLLRSLGNRHRIVDIGLVVHNIVTTQTFT